MISRPSNPNISWALFQAMFPHIFDGDRVRRGLTADKILDPLKRNGIGPSYAYSLSKLIREYPDNFNSPEDVGRIQDALTALGIDSDQWERHKSEGLSNSVGHFGRLKPLSEVSVSSDSAS
jgi:hypothetical protein